MDYNIHSIKQVKIQDKFWGPRIGKNSSVTIWDNINKCETSSRIDNFRLAAGLIDGDFSGLAYDDSDVFKTIEAAAYSLEILPDKNLEDYIDNLINIIAKAQEEDGYLYTIRTTIPKLSKKDLAGKTRWSYLMLSHELYNMGHLYEAAIAYYNATGKKSLLNVAIKNINLIKKTFGPDNDKLHLPPGHQEIELALIKMFRLTNNNDYINLARYFLDIRGRKNIYKLYAPPLFRSILQNHKPVINQTHAKGHSVRALYMYSAMVDIAALMDDLQYKNAVTKIWNDIVSYKMSISGGVGSKRDYERFGSAYHLPNSTCYNETCASIAMIFFSHRMFLLTGHSKYVDVIERVLYNGFLVGVNLAGDRYFYPNVLQSDGLYQFNQNESATRNPWFSTSCCPTNIARTFPQLKNFIYARSGSTLFINLYVDSIIDTISDKRNNVKSTLEPNKIPVKLHIQTNYPWSGDVHIKLLDMMENEFSIALRIPGWVKNEPVPSNLYSYKHKYENSVKISINGQLTAISTIINGYYIISKVWKKGDYIDIHFPMPVRQIISHKSIKSNIGKIAIERGPLLYCAESVDNDNSVLNISLPANLIPDNFSLIPDKMQYLDYIKIDVPAYKRKKTRIEMWNPFKHQLKFFNYNLNHIFASIKEKLHSFISKHSKYNQKINVSLIPYFLWSNRGENEMIVWFPVVKE